MTSFMSKKKKYKFQVEICLEELMEVPFVSAVLFAKLRLLDGGSFQDHSSRQEVRDHKVQWDAKFAFPCKMMANASTGVMEKCILRISIRKECKGGRSFTKLGFADLNLAEYAGAGLIRKKALLEGYDARHRQDNSMLKFRIQLNMISGDILFKAPSPSLKHKPITVMEDATTDQRSDEYSSGSLAGSINSGSSGFGSLPKKRTPNDSVKTVGHQDTGTEAVSHDLVAEHAAADSALTSLGVVQELGHSRNSSNTSQMSKASGYSSISHSRQSSSGDSAAGHIRNAAQHDSLRRPASKFHRTYTFPKHRLNIPNTILSESPGPLSSGFHTPQGPDSAPPAHSNDTFYTPPTSFVTPIKTSRQSDASSPEEVFQTPEACFGDVFDKNFNQLQKSASSGVVERFYTSSKHFEKRSKNHFSVTDPPYAGVFLSKSDHVIPKRSPQPPRSERILSHVISAFLTPHMSRKDIGAPSTPLYDLHALSKEETRAASMGNLKWGAGEGTQLAVYGRLHRKVLLEGPSLTKLTQCDSPPEDGAEEGDTVIADDCSRRPSTTLTLNPSSGSLQTTSDSGSLDRAKAAYERRKKNPGSTNDDASAPGRVEITRVDPADFVADLLRSTDLEQPDDSAETSGLQLFIAKDGTASLGGHEVKSQMSTGVGMFKQVVMDDRRAVF